MKSSGGFRMLSKKALGNMASKGRDITNDSMAFTSESSVPYDPQNEGDNA